MYITRAATKAEIASLERTISLHTVVGFDADGRPCIHTSDERSAQKVPEVVLIRRRMPSGRELFRVILRRFQVGE